MKVIALQGTLRVRSSPMLGVSFSTPMGVVSTCASGEGKNALCPADDTQSGFCPRYDMHGR